MSTGSSLERIPMDDKSGDCSYIEVTGYHRFSLRKPKFALANTNIVYMISLMDIFVLLISSSSGGDVTTLCILQSNISGLKA